MKKRNSFIRLLKLTYIKLFRIHDSPQKIALGFGVGVFTGIFPGTGPIAALFLAFILKVNRISALLGSLLTNTWLSLVTFLLSIKTGSAIMNLNWQDTYRDWTDFLKGFSFAGLFKLSILKIVLPVAIGYLIVASCAGLLAYLAMVIIFKIFPRHLGRHNQGGTTSK